MFLSMLVGMPKTKPSDFKSYWFFLCFWEMNFIDTLFFLQSSMFCFILARISGFSFEFCGEI